MGSPALVAIVLWLTPFMGNASGAGTTAAATFSVHISGKPGRIVRLRAIDTPPGYVAGFCTDRVCAPFRVSLALPRSGRTSIELKLIENIAGARKPRTVTVGADGARASIPFARGTTSSAKNPKEPRPR